MRACTGPPGWAVNRLTCCDALAIRLACCYLYFDNGLSIGHYFRMRAFARVCVCVHVSSMYQRCSMHTCIDFYFESLYHNSQIHRSLIRSIDAIGTCFILKCLFMTARLQRWRQPHSIHLCESWLIWQTCRRYSTLAGCNFFLVVEDIFEL